MCYSRGLLYYGISEENNFAGDERGAYGILPREKLSGNFVYRKRWEGRGSEEKESE